MSEHTDRPTGPTDAPDPTIRLTGQQEGPETEALPQEPGEPDVPPAGPTSPSGPDAGEPGAGAAPRRSIQDWMSEDEPAAASSADGGFSSGPGQAPGATPLGHSTSGVDTAVTTAPTDPVPVGARVGTIVWGLVLVLLGLAVVAIGAGFQLDLEATLIGLLLLAGVALLVGAIGTSVRGSRRR